MAGDMKDGISYPHLLTDVRQSYQQAGGYQTFENSESPVIMKLHAQDPADDRPAAASASGSNSITSADDYNHTYDASKKQPAQETVASLIEEAPKKSWKSYLWDTLDKSPEERRFLFKLDAWLLTAASLGYFIKNLDQYNINNAFVSGMKEDLNLYGNELNIMQTMWTVGYVIGEIPRLAWSSA